MGIDQPLKAKREEILAILLQRRCANATKHGAYNVQVFGSVARREAKADSDVDFLVEIEPGRNLLDRLALIQELEDLLGRKVDVAKPENLHEYIRNQVLEAVTL
jgi:predicted nucleotidyltransferase